MEKIAWNKDKIREFRKSLGLNQGDFAIKLGVSRQQTISAWEVGFHEPGKMAKRLLDQLYFGQSMNEAPNELQAG